VSSREGGGAGRRMQRVREKDAAFATLSQSALRDFIQMDAPGLMRAIHAVASREGESTA